MQIFKNRFAILALIAAFGVSFIGSVPVGAKPLTKRVVTKQLGGATAVRPSPALTSRADAQAMITYGANFNAAILNISPASDALGLMYSQATPDIFTLSASERTALANSWVASVGARTGIARDAFRLMGQTPRLVDPGLQRQADGFASARTDVLAVLDRFDQAAQRLSALVKGWTPARNEEVVAALVAERTQSQGEILRAFAVSNTAIAASMVPEAPSRHINVAMASMYTALAATVDLRVSKINATQAAQIIGQRAISMRVQSPQGRQKVLALQARLRMSLASPNISAADQGKVRTFIGVIGDYNTAFDLSDRISVYLDQVQVIVLKNDAAALGDIDVIIGNISALELELMDIIRNLTRRLAL